MLGYVASALAYIAFESILVNVRSTFGYIGFIVWYVKVNWEYFEAYFEYYFGVYWEYFESIRRAP